MAATKVVLSHVPIVLSCIVALLLSQVSALDGFESQELKICGFDAIYNIGDSLSNTGNKIRINSSIAESRLPDGTAVRSLVPLDYIVKSAGFSSIKAYLNTNETDSHNGVNFAFSGASTLPAKVLVPKLKVDAGVIVNTLGTQLQWFDRYLKGFCRKPKDCKEKLKSSLFIMGEIGANDYNMAFHFASKTIEEVKRMGLVFDNVKSIKKAIEKVIHYGVTRVLVPGIYRVGCAPGYVSKFAESNTLDKYGCVKEYNDFFNYHNDLLQANLEKLRKKYPGVSIVYGDYYNAMQFVMDNYKKFGFEYITQGCYIDQESLMIWTFGVNIWTSQAMNTSLVDNYACQDLLFSQVVVRSRARIPSAPAKIWECCSDGDRVVLETMARVKLQQLRVGIPAPSLSLFSATIFSSIRIADMLDQDFLEEESEEVDDDKEEDDEDDYEKDDTVDISLEKELQTVLPCTRTCNRPKRKPRLHHPCFA
ncbi:hypothetical protein Peur_019459 [Populus x canadensis]